MIDLERMLLRVLCVLCLVEVAACLGNGQITPTESILSIKKNIQNTTSAYCHGAHSNTVKAFHNKMWQTYLGDVVALVYPFCMKTNELGNRLGNYFNEMACAEVIGADFITIHSQWEIAGSYLSHNNDSVNPFVFLNSLPEYVVHQQPVSFSAAQEKVRTACKCTQYCWQDRNAPWMQALPSIKKYVMASIMTYFEHKNAKVETIHANDISNAKPTDIMPIVPDVAIQYRCGDNLGFNYMYGILPFHVLKSRIPSSSKYIYVLSDHPARSAHSPYASRCQVIVQTLFDYLVTNFPGAVIVIKRGGDMFLDYARLALAKVTICSASTYCLWPAIANDNIVHFPMTYLVAGVDTADLIVNLTSNFYWIKEAEIITNFNKLRPWQKILDVLVGNATM